SVAAGRDIALTGSSVTGAGDVGLQAGRHINLQAATDTTATTHDSRTVTSGLQRAPGGGFGFAIGNRDVRDATTSTTLTNVGSLIGSTGGNVSLLARGDLTWVGSVLAAPNGDLTVVANSIAMSAARDVATSSPSHSDSFRGLTVSAGAGAGNPLAQASQA